MATTTLAALDTVYECGEQTTDRRCPDCHLFTRRLGPGGHCPSCDELVLISDILTTNQARSTTGSYTEDLTGSDKCVTPYFFGGGFNVSATIARWSSVLGRPDRASSCKPGTPSAA